MDFTQLKNLLESECSWPSTYMFKFVGRPEDKEIISKIIGNEPSQERESKSGKYTSYTYHLKLNNPDEVIAIYKEVGKNSGIICL